MGKKEVILFNAPKIEKKADKLELSGRFPRIGVASIAAYLKKKGIKVKIVDPMIEDWEKIFRKIKRFKPQFVAISAYTSEMYDAAHTAELIKKIDPKIVTVIGGAHANAIPRETLEEFPWFDIACYGEGELTMAELAKGKRKEKILGIAYRKGGKIRVNPPRKHFPSLDELPPPAWELYNLEAYRGGSLVGDFTKGGKILELPVESARGCPFRCIFCFRYGGFSIRFKSPKKTVDEVERDVRKFGASKIHFVEGTFGVNKKNAMEMCRELIRRNLHKKITWSSGGRANVVDRELLTLMRQSGCNFLGFGVESGNKRLLEKIGKGISLDQIKKAFIFCKEIGIETEANFIIGHPWETEKTVEETIRFAKDLEADTATFAILVPFPGTVVAKMAERGKGGLRIVSKDWRFYGKQIGQSLELKNLPYQRLKQFQMKAYRSFYLTPKRFPYLVKRLNPPRVIYGIRSLISGLMEKTKNVWS